MWNLESEHILKNVSQYEIVYESMAINRKTGIFLQPQIRRRSTFVSK